MSDQGWEDFLILRELDEPITEEELEVAGEQTGQTLESSGTRASTSGGSNPRY